MKKSVLQKTKSAFSLSYLVIIVLFCLVMSTSFMSISYVAKYLSTDGDFDGARVAKWDVSVDFSQSNADYTLKKEYQNVPGYIFTVTSNSEVAVSYDVVLTFPKDTSIPSSVDFTIEDITPTVSEDGLVYTFEDVGTFTADGGTNEHMIKVTSDFTHDSLLIDNISVDVVLTQID